MIHTLLTAAALLAPATGQANVALVTEVSGGVTWRLSAATPTAPVRAFMKTRPGDIFELEEGAAVRIVYYRAGNEERWEGPASFTIGAEASVPAGRNLPTVAQLPPSGAQALARVPRLLKRAGAVRLGATRVRAAMKKERWRSLDSLSEVERKEYDEARKMVTALRKDRGPTDPMPDLIWLGVLGKLKLEAELRADAAAAHQRFPQVEAFSKIDAWLSPKPAPPAAGESTPE